MSEYANLGILDTDLDKLLDYMRLTPCALCGEAYTAHLGESSEHLWSDERLEGRGQ